MNYYRLEVNPEEINKVLDTNLRNNIQRCPYQNEFSEILRTIMSVSYQTKLSLIDTYALAESVVYDVEEWQIAVEIDQCFWNETHINYNLIILINRVFHYHYEDCEKGKCSIAFDLNNEEHKSYIWNYIYEEARLQIIQSGSNSDINVGRFDSAYFFKTIEDCEKFKSYFGMGLGIICNVEIIEEYDSFVGDMNILEELPELTSTATDVLLASADYWLGKTTNNPILEVLFHGKYKLSPINDPSN